MLRSFYEFWIELGVGPLVNPVVLDRNGRRANAHHNPLEPFQAEGRIRYNPKVPKRRPRALPDDRWNELFAALRSNRDRAILALGISNAARASELLGVRGVDLDWGEQLVRVTRKGQRRRAVAAGQPRRVRVDPAISGRAGPARAGRAVVVDAASPRSRRRAATSADEL